MTNRKEYMKKYQQEHKEAFRIATQKYRDKDRKKYNEYNNEYRKRKRKEAKENAELVIKYKEVLDKIKEEVEYWGYDRNTNDDSAFRMAMKKIHHLLEELYE